MVMTHPSSGNSSPFCAPTFGTPRRPERPTFGPRVGKIARLLGTPLMDWQQHVADVACEVLPNGRPAYTEVNVFVPRQSGKTTLLFSWQLERCVTWGSPQHVGFTAHTGQDARKKWMDDLLPVLKRSPLMAAVDRIYSANGNEGIQFKTSSIMRLYASSEGVGHGMTLDQAVMDEVWHDQDDRREQGLRPAMITKQDRQLLVCSTAGHDGSLVYNRKLASGRHAVREDTGTGIAYFEWSAPDDWDPEDQDTWWTFMPALGHTIQPDAIEAERRALPDGEFLRAYGNRATRSVDRLIPQDSWPAVCDPDAKPEGRIRFALDITEDRGAASIVACDQSGTLELVDHRQGVGWVPDRVLELAERYGSLVTIDDSGPAGSLEGLRSVRRVKGADVVKACGAMYDAIIEAKVRFRTDPYFDEAVAGVVKRESGDRWAWSRKASVTDITPLMAATLVLHANKPSPYEDHGIEFI